jgi:hypothetical protein
MKQNKKAVLFLIALLIITMVTSWEMKFLNFRLLNPEIIY